MSMFGRKLVARLVIIGTLWLGLGLLTLLGKTDGQLLVQAGIFSALVVFGCALESLLHFEGDAILLSTVQLITAIGLVFLVRIRPAIALHQFWWANIGLVVFYVVVWGLRDYRGLTSFQYLWGLTAVLLLLITLLFGMSANGARSWLKIGSLGFEPEELVKVALLLFLASYLGEHEEILRVGTVQWGRISLPDGRTLGPFFVMAAFCLGLLAAQKSLGTALVFYALFVLMLYTVTERSLYLVVSLPVLLMTGLLGYYLFGHVRVRVGVWLHPWGDPTGGGYQVAQSLFAIGGGGVLGTGLGNGIGAFQVPEASTDFVFAVIAEELGFAGAAALLGLFLVVVCRAFVVSAGARDRFGQILAAGIGILLSTETLIILAGVTKLLPLTGIPLPWVSYGGSSLLVHFLLLGLLAHISHVNTSGSLTAKAKGKECAA